MDANGGSRLLLELIAKRALLQPAHGQQVGHRPQESIEDVVMRLALRPRAIVHRNLRDGAPVHLDERREETVHAVEASDLRQAFATERLESAAGVLDDFA